MYEILKEEILKAYDKISYNLDFIKDTFFFP